MLRLMNPFYVRDMMHTDILFSGVTITRDVNCVYIHHNFIASGDNTGCYTRKIYHYAFKRKHLIVRVEPNRDAHIANEILTNGQFFFNFVFTRFKWIIFNEIHWARANNPHTSQVQGEETAWKQFAKLADTFAARVSRLYLRLLRAKYL